MMKPEDVQEVFKRFQNENPEPKTELFYTNPYTLLVAVVLSAQATDKGVNKATTSLFANVSTPQQMLELGLGGLARFIKTIGLYNNKAKNIMALSEILVRNHQGQVPQTRQELEALPGVGHKTANVVLNVAFGQPVIAVDTHIFRVGNRTGLAAGKTVKEVEENLEKRVPPCFRLHAHHWLILHGRYVCKAKKPLCYDCLIKDLCCFPEKNLKI